MRWIFLDFSETVCFSSSKRWILLDISNNAISSVLSTVLWTDKYHQQFYPRILRNNSNAILSPPSWMHGCPQPLIPPQNTHTQTYTLTHTCTHTHTHVTPPSLNYLKLQPGGELDCEVSSTYNNMYSLTIFSEQKIRGAQWDTSKCIYVSKKEVCINHCNVCVNLWIQF